MGIVQIRGIFELKEDRGNINMSVYSIFIYTVPCFFELPCMRVLFLLGLKVVF